MSGLCYYLPHANMRHLKPGTGGRDDQKRLKGAVSGTAALGRGKARAKKKPNQSGPVFMSQFN